MKDKDHFFQKQKKNYLETNVCVNCKAKMWPQETKCEECGFVRK